MIKVERISFSYGKNEIFKDLTACFEKEKFYCIIGKNGNGKSTLLKLLSGMLLPDSGEILVDGKRMAEYSRREYAQKTAFLPQEREIVDITVYDYVSNGRYPYLGITRKLSREDKRIVSESITKTNLEHKTEQSISNLSGGERQRVYISSILAQNTSYVLLDEPTTYLDVYARFEVMNYLADMSKSGKGVIAVMHDISLAMKYADYLFVLDKDNCEYTLCTPLQAYENDLIEKVFDVKCKAINNDGRNDYLITEK